MSTAVYIFLSAILCVMLFVGVMTGLDNKKKRQTVSVMYDDKIYFDACRSLFVRYRKIRHDFANYVQAAQMVPDEESREMLKAQKKSIRHLIGQWTAEKDTFLKMSEEQTWNYGS